MAFLCGETSKLHAQEGLSAALGSKNIKDVDASADSYEYVGSNIIAKGHVVIRFKDTQIIAEKAIININTQDIEAVGNVTFLRSTTSLQKMDYQEYQDMTAEAGMKLEVNRIITTDTGNQQIEAKVTKNVAYMRADRASGNIQTGAFMFKNFAIKAGALYCAAEEADRTPDGQIDLKNARFTTCEYMLDNHDHYALKASKATLSPREANKGLANYNPDHGEHSVWAYDTTFRLWDVPVLWLPALYKPADESGFGVQFEMGSSTEMGYYLRTSKGFQLVDEPVIVRAAALFDFYSKRGFGFGATTDIISQESKTEIFAYGISDKNPYNAFDSDNNAASPEDAAKQYDRFTIPRERYELKLANITHITPRLDFRGQFDKISDYNFLSDFFPDRYDTDIQPPTFASLEYQFDRFSAAIAITPKVNYFDSVMQKLPEGRLDFQRQELFKNIYYQGESSAGYYKMSWRDFDTARTATNYVDPRNYSSGRFDTLHMFYYPFELFDAINLIPRAGGRFTAYTNSSKQKIDCDDLNNILIANSLDGNPESDVVNYDNNGGSQYRFAGELGIEANTKIYRSWQNVKQSWLELDGIRHVAIPYVNYQFMPKPTVDRDHLYYFDDIDRLEEQNFVRLGAVNRLQTRRDNKIYEWMSLENYWDYHFTRQEDFNNVGDLGTIYKFKPFEGLTLTSDLLLDLGQSNDHDTDAERAGRDGGRPGVSWKYINRWHNYLTYQITQDWRVYGGYYYSDAYAQQAAYSMGSTLTSINPTTAFEAAYDRVQNLNGGIEFPTYIDKHLKGAFEVQYDVETALMRNASFSLTRKFHCWRVIATVGTSQKRNSDDGKANSNYVAFSIGLTASPSTKLATKYGNSGGR